MSTSGTPASIRIRGPRFGYRPQVDARRVDDAGDARGDQRFGGDAVEVLVVDHGDVAGLRHAARAASSDGRRGRDRCSGGVASGGARSSISMPWDGPPPAVRRDHGRHASADPDVGRPRVADAPCPAPSPAGRALSSAPRRRRARRSPGLGRGRRRRHRLGRAGLDPARLGEQLLRVRRRGLAAGHAREHPRELLDASGVVEARDDGRPRVLLHAEVTIRERRRSAAGA